MKAKKEIDNSNNSLTENFHIGLFIILILFIGNAFIQSDGIGYIKKTWNHVFNVREARITAIPTPTPTGCRRAWSVSQKKFINICNTRSEALTDCSKKTRESLITAVPSLKNVSDVEKFRELVMKMCMEEYGFDY